MHTIQFLHKPKVMPCIVFRQVSPSLFGLELLRRIYLICIMDSEALNALLIKRLMVKNNLHSLDYGTMDKLSGILKVQYAISVSPTTLSRLGGLRKHETKKYFGFTLDTLAKAADFINYEQFRNFVFAKDSLLLHNNTEIALPFISQYTLQAASNNDIKYLESLSKYVADTGYSFDMYNILGGALLNGLRTNKRPLKVLDFLSSTPIMIDAFFESFVDTDYISSYYGQGMTLLSKKLKEVNRTYLFANCVALLYEKRNGLMIAYQKRAKKLGEVSIDYLDKLVYQNCIFPVARWIQSMLEYYLLTGDIAKSDLIFEYAFEKVTILPSDNAIIIINQISEVGEILPTNYLLKIRDLYTLKSEQVTHEFDSMVNAGLNISILLNNNKIIKEKNIETLMTQYPYQFIICKESIMDKMNRVYN